MELLFRIISKMPTFIIDWFICNGNNNFYLNEDWHILLVWLSHERRPKSIIIERKFAVEGIWVTSNLEIAGGCTVQSIKGVHQRIRSGCTSAEIPLEYSIVLYNKLQGHAFKSCRIRGEITVTEKEWEFYDARVWVRKETISTVKLIEERYKEHIYPYLELSKDFENLLEPSYSCFTDVELKCASVSIRAHKNILSARSSVFASILINDMKESQENKLDVTDMDESTFRAMLRYIYTGKIGNLTVEAASDLLTASDKYDLTDLKTICINFLKKNVSLQNVLKILNIGHIHSDELISVAKSYICDNCEDFYALEETEDWQILRNQSPSVVIDVLISLVYHREVRLKHCMQRKK